MKKIYEKTIIQGLKYTIDLALILIFIGVIVGVFTAISLIKENPSPTQGNFEFNGATISSGINSIMISLQNSNHGVSLESIQYKFHIFFFLCGFVNVIALILVTVQLRYIFKSFNQEGYFYSSNSKRIKKIAIIIFIWVLADYIISFIPEISSLHDFVSSSIGLNSFRFGIINGITGINFKILIVSIIIYMLSIVFNYGSILKEESSLTI